jgi:hypothetical protein
MRSVERWMGGPSDRRECERRIRHYRSFLCRLVVGICEYCLVSKHLCPGNIGLDRSVGLQRDTFETAPA